MDLVDYTVKVLNDVAAELARQRAEIVAAREQLAADRERVLAELQAKADEITAARADAKPKGRRAAPTP